MPNNEISLKVKYVKALPNVGIDGMIYAVPSENHYFSCNKERGFTQLHCDWVDPVTGYQYLVFDCIDHFQAECYPDIWCIDQKNRMAYMWDNKYNIYMYYKDHQIPKVLLSRRKCSKALGFMPPSPLEKLIGFFTGNKRDPRKLY